MNAKAWPPITSMISVHKADWTIVGVIGIVLIALINAISSTHVWELLEVFIGRMAKACDYREDDQYIAGVTLLLLGVNMWL